VGNWRKENADDVEDSIFANNPFLDDLLEWRHSPEGQQFAELADALCDLMEDVELRWSALMRAPPNSLVRCAIPAKPGQRRR
jgi:hypothetical protein